LTVLFEECEVYKEEYHGNVLAEFKDVMSEIPGKTEVVRMIIEVDSQIPHRLPNGLKEAVRSELDEI